MDNYNLTEADDILDYFDIDRMTEIVNDQIINASDYTTCGVVIDYLKPLYAKYKSIQPDIENNIDAEKYSECTKNFNVIMVMFTDAICNKFGIVIDDLWLENASDDDRFLLVLYLYSLFIIDFKTIVTDICINYVDANYEELSAMLDSEKSQKSATYNAIYNLTNNAHLAVICSNIFDVIYYIFDSLNMETLFEYMPEDYLPMTELKPYFEDGTVGGDIYAEMFKFIKENSSLRSSMAFDVISYIKNNYKVANAE